MQTSYSLDEDGGMVVLYCETIYGREGALMLWLGVQVGVKWRESTEQATSHCIPSLISFDENNFSFLFSLIGCQKTVLKAIQNEPHNENVLVRRIRIQA